MKFCWTKKYLNAPLSTLRKYAFRTRIPHKSLNYYYWYRQSSADWHKTNTVFYIRIYAYKNLWAILVVEIKTKIAKSTYLVRGTHFILLRKYVILRPPCKKKKKVARHRRRRNNIIMRSKVKFDNNPTES